MNLEPRLALVPRFAAGMVGAGLVIALYFVDSAFRASGGAGLPPVSLLVLLVPGALAGWLCDRRGALDGAEKEAAFAGLLTGTAGSIVLIVALVVGVINIDWTAYETTVGAEIASAVREAVVPAAAVAGLVSVAVVYVASIGISWAGVLLYKLLAGRK